MTGKKKEFTDSLDARAAKYGLLGSLCWWGNLNAAIPPEELRRAATAAGLPEKLIPSLPTPSRAFRRAAKSVESLEKGWRVELLKDNATEITYGILQREITEDGTEASWRQIARISCFLSLNHHISSDRPHNEAIQKIMNALSFYQDNFITQDIGQMIDNTMMHVQALSMAINRQNSRLVLADGVVTVNALAETLKVVKGSNFMVINVPDDDTSKASMQTAARSEFSISIQTAEEELARLKAAIAEAKTDSGRTGPRETTIKARIEEYKTLQAQVNMYAGVLNFKADDMTQKLQEVQTALQELLGIK